MNRLAHPDTALCRLHLNGIASSTPHGHVTACSCGRRWLRGDAVLWRLLFTGAIPAGYARGQYWYPTRKPVTPGRSS